MIPSLIFQGSVHPITFEIREGLDVWILAEKLQLPENPKDNIMDIWTQNMKDEKRLMSFLTKSRAYQMNAQPSPFSRLAVDMLRFVLTANGKKFSEAWPLKEIHQMLESKSDLVDDFLKSMRQMPTASDPRQKARCCSHCHAEGEHCYAKEDSPERTEEDHLVND